MIVVPSLAESDHRDEEIISTIIIGGITTFSKDMGQGIYREGPMVEQHRADEKSTDKQQWT